MLVAQNSLGPVCPVPLTVRGSEHLVDKYEKKRWAPKIQPPEPPDLMTFEDAPTPPPEEDFFASFGV